MTRGYMMTAAALTLAGTMLVGGCNKKAKEESDAAGKPATKAEAQKMADKEGKKMADDQKVDTAMENMKNNAAATTQKAGDMAHDMGTATGAEVDKMKQNMPTTAPSMR